jgi:hypothetical protein
MKQRSLRLSSSAALLFLGTLAGFARAQAAAQATVPDLLLQGFADPPNSARPRVWWHWMNGNITERGIDLDLDWMHRIGIGGFHTFDVALSTPTIVDYRLIYMTPEWKQAFRHAVARADGLGLEITIASSPGWSETGGPWVQPAQAMKKLVWSETLVPGGKPFHDVLPAPPQVAGVFQDLAVKGGPSFYKDVAVLAYPITRQEPTPSLSTPEGPVSEAAGDGLRDGLIAAPALTLRMAPSGKDIWVQFSYSAPQSLQAMDIAIQDDPTVPVSLREPAHISLETSEDGLNFVPAIEPIDIAPGSWMLHTISFPAVTSKFFRVTFHSPHPPRSTGAATGYALSELRLYAEPRNSDFESKAGFVVARNYYTLPPAAASPGTAIQQKTVLDLTGKMAPDGTLAWTPPPGDWRVLRLGYSLTGKTNHPAPPEATGLEVDQLSQPDVAAYVDHYLATYADTVGNDRIGARGIRFMLTDSVETGPQNWTDDMLAQFQSLRGYDASRWLPALTGAVIESPEATDRFLWDFRRTIAELVSSSHYDTIAKALHARGLGYYGEALESGRPQLGDDLEMRRFTDIPMGAMWVSPDNGPEPRYESDLRGAASVAHIYGRNLVGAESLTSKVRPWGFAPEDLKPAADMEMAYGVNRFMIHETALQPVTDKLPGLSLGIYGQWFNRNETWAEQAKPWIDYLARCSFLLQQGRFHADLAYFYGEEAPLTIQFDAERGLPQNNGFDFVNSDILLHEISVAADGSLVTTGGASYRILYLGGSSQRMTVPVLRRLLDLVQKGAVIAGSKPLSSPSQADDTAEFHRLADQLWGITDSSTTRQVGKGLVLHAASATEALHVLSVAPDWSYTAKDPAAHLVFVHRHLDDGDAYFVLNTRKQAATVQLSFGVTGKTPELWLPDTGQRRPVSYTIAKGRTTIPLQLDSSGSVFLVFRSPATASSLKVPEPAVNTLATLTGAWQVDFEPGRGAPEHTTFDRLVSWSEHPDAGIRFFSGHATYRKTLTAPTDWFKPGQTLWLDLGGVGDLAEVTVNGNAAGIAWKPPFRLDITPLLHPGENKIEVRVVNLWVNRLIGDRQPGATQYTFTALHPYHADSPLLSSGLLGPVRIIEQSSTPEIGKR